MWSRRNTSIGPNGRQEGWGGGVGGGHLLNIYLVFYN